ncbi:hypothetical protein [Bordetella sp. N]|uniref:hypothetical protein n=1 Tax=Bordetella sp. N TaxID=1746199 RepID=UPI00070B95DB|nr:hypothetical protein [Bordetella sp. N]ALM86048.1 hypothetical protein ASB57_26605 [Bordetella sp. N]
MPGWFSFSQWSSRLTAGIGGIAAIAVSWGIGLFETRTAPVRPVLPVGQAIEAGQWTVRLDRVDVSDRMPGASRAYMAGRQVIVLYLQATNRTAATSNAFMQAVKLDTPIQGVDARPTAYLLRDHVVLADLQPALPEEMALVWTLPANQTVPATVRFTVEAMRYKAADNLYAQPLWSDPRQVGVVDLPVTPRQGVNPT